MLSSGAILALGLPVGSSGVVVDLAGNLGGASLYGRGPYGRGLYSLGGAFEPTFSADLTIPAVPLLAGSLSPVVAFSSAILVDAAHVAGNLAPVVTLSANFDIVGNPYFDGDLAPVVTLAGHATLLTGLAGNLAPQVTLAATLGLSVNLAGNLAPQIGLGASLTGTVPIQGDLPFGITFAAASLTAGPLWAADEPCATVDWKETELCNG